MITLYAPGLTVEVRDNAVVVPPPPPPPPVVSDRVLVESNGYHGVNFVMANSFLGSHWVNPGGDYLDKNGVFNGPDSYLSYPITVANEQITVDVSGIDGDLFIHGLWGWYTIALDGVTLDGKKAFSVNYSSGQATEGCWYQYTAFVINDAKGKTLFINSSGRVGETLRIDKVAGPLLASYPVVPPMSATVPDIWEVDMVDESSIDTLFNLANRQASGGRAQCVYDHEFGVTASGLKYMRFTTETPGKYGNPIDAPINQRLIDFPCQFPKRQSAYSRFCVYIESDVWVNFTELGLKLPGLSNMGTQRVEQSQNLQYNMDHSAPTKRTKDAYGLMTYFYDSASGGGFGEMIEFPNCQLLGNKWYCIEQFIDVGTPGVGNGGGAVWINGNKVYEFSGRMCRTFADSFLSCFNVLFYHGGMGHPKGPMHYRLAKPGVSSTRIGVPAEFPAS